MLSEGRVEEELAFELWFTPLLDSALQELDKEVSRVGQTGKVSWMDDILDKLKGGDRRSIGRANEVVGDVLNEPALFGAVFNGLLDDDPVVRMRAADAIEKITEKRPEYLQPYKAVLIQQVAAIEQQEVRWHVAQMVPRLKLSEEERGRVAVLLFGYLDDKSKIVQVNAMQALAELAEADESLLPGVVEAVEGLTKTGSPAVRNRGIKLLEKLKSQKNCRRRVSYD